MNKTDKVLAVLTLIATLLLTNVFMENSATDNSVTVWEQAELPRHIIKHNPYSPEEYLNR